MIGRPREFDEKTVLEAAGEAFWSKGYEATSTRDLAACTGLTPSSMYGAFGDKRALYLRALNHYLDRTLRERISQFESALSPGQALMAFFRDVIDRSLADPEHRGCLLVNTALQATPDDADLQRFVAGEIRTIEEFFGRCIGAAQTSGEITSLQDTEDLARHLLSVLLGLRVLARVRPDAALLEGLVRPAFALLGLPWRAAGAEIP